MSSARKGTQPTSPPPFESVSATDLPAPLDPLTGPERMQLGKLGWQKQDLEGKSPHEARIILKAKTYRPGSEAFLRHAALNPLTGKVGMPEEADRISDEAIAKRQEGKPLRSVEVLSDEFAGKCLQASEEMFDVTETYNGVVVRGADPLNAVIQQAVYEDLKANNGRRTRRFRIKDPTLNVAMTGPMPQPVRHKSGDKKGQIVETEGGILTWLPIEVHEEYYRKPLRKQLDMMDRRIQRTPEDADIALGPDEAAMVPVATSQVGPDGIKHPSGVLTQSRDTQVYTERPNIGG